MTVCLYSKYYVKNKSYIELLEVISINMATDAQMNLAMAMACGEEIACFRDDVVGVLRGEEVKIFDAILNPGDLLKVINTGEFVISSDALGMCRALQLPENEDLKKEKITFCIHSLLAGSKFFDSNLARCLGKSAIARVLNDSHLRLTQNEEDSDFREISRMRDNPYRHAC